jgi:hypothetical protein
MPSKVTLLRLLEADEKLAPQQKIIYDQLLAYGGGEPEAALNKEIDREKLVKDIEASGKMQTRQTVDRILAYYLNHFKKIGMMSASTTVAQKAPKTDGDKPAKGKGKGAKSPAEAEAKPEKEVSGDSAPIEDTPPAESVEA